MVSPLDPTIPDRLLGVLARLLVGGVPGPWWLAIVEDRIDAAAHASGGLFRLPNGRFGSGSVKMITFLGTPIWHPSLLLTSRGLECMNANDPQWRTLAGAIGVTVYQRSKTVWVAAGKYKGQDFEVKARSPQVALALWKEAARYAGSDW